MLCKQCNKNTTNPQFCSRSCSVSYNNSNKPKRQLTKKCAECSHPILSTRQKLCTDCKKPPNLDLTLEEAIYAKHHRSNAYSLIRTRARSIAYKLGLHNQCQNCGYNKHVEICHKKPISQFPLDTKVSVINHESNLIVLCRNCHWEFDNNILTL